MLFYALILTFISATENTAPLDSICEPNFKKCYKFVHDAVNFVDAEEKCQTFGGHLVAIENGFENVLIGETAASVFNGQTDFWIGGNYILKGKWSWTDGSDWGYADWLSGEPKTNDVVAADCKTYSWKSVAITSLKPFVCELSMNTGNVPTLSPQKTCPTVKPKTCPACATEVPPTCPTCPHTPHCEDGWTRFSKTNSCYKEFFKQTFWGAETLCQQYGAHLASIHSEEENVFVSELLSVGYASNYGNNSLVGIYQELGQWYWTDKSPINYVNWGRPDPAQQGTCGGTFPDGNPSFPGWTMKWEGEPCDTVLRNFVCKKLSL